VSLVLLPSPDGVPTLLHWGHDLGDLGADELAALGSLHAPGIPHSALDRPRHLSLLPDNVSGFTGTPALEGFRVGGGVSPRLGDWTWQVDDSGEDASIALTGRDQEAGWEAVVELELTREGIVRQRATVTNVGGSDLELSAVRLVLPVAPAATELLDLTGRWTRERLPQRGPFLVGKHLREGRHGRTGHDATLAMVAGTSGFSFQQGEVWGVHVAWSGDHATYAERTPEGECLLGGGELLAPGEVTLAPGESFSSPWLHGAWANDGLDGLSWRWHRWVRRHSPRTRSVRPVVLNTWEATYFDHDLGKLAALADAAAQVGVERLVLDDGWFAGRRDDRAGLGDWTVDRSVWPDGLAPLIKHVQALGMDFGLWVEPEMINVDSDLARAHPDWILRGRSTLPEEWRHQQVLDLQVPEAYAHLRDALLAVLAENDIAFLKWDHNRDLVDVAHDGRPAVGGQTLAFYRLLDELRAAHPRLEIESCASGGGRVDLEVLTRTDRIWPSDSIDPLNRQVTQRWTSLVVPPELIGSHVGGAVAHTTGRTAPLPLRAASALLGHFGIEADLTTLDADERTALRAWVDLHKEVRRLLGTGRLIRIDHPDPAVVATGIVGPDLGSAYVVVVTTAPTATQHPAPVRVPGLAPERRYLLRNVTPPGGRHVIDLGHSWLDGPGVTTSGAVLAARGFGLPVTAPESAYVVHLSATP